MSPYIKMLYTAHLLSKKVIQIGIPTTDST